MSVPDGLALSMSSLQLQAELTTTAGEDLSYKQETPKLIPPELLRQIALLAHPESALRIKHSNRYLNDFITNTDLDLCERRWRLTFKPPLNTLFWIIRRSPNTPLPLFINLLSTLPTASTADLLPAAINADHTAFIRSLLTKGPLLYPHESNKLLAYACYNAKPSAVSLFLANYVFAQESLNQALSETQCPIIASLLLEAGAEVNQVPVYPSMDSAPVTQAAIYANRPLLTLYVERGATPESLKFALKRVAALGHKDAVKLLLDVGADVNFTQGPMVEAIHKGHDKVLALLLDARPVRPTLETLNEAFDRARAGHPRAAKIVIGAITDVLIKGKASTPTLNNALFNAVKYGNAGAVRRLMKAGIKVKPEEPLCLAAELGHVEVVLLFLGREPSVRGIEDALIKAAGTEHANIVKHLLKALKKAGADTTIARDDQFKRQSTREAALAAALPLSRAPYPTILLKLLGSLWDENVRKEQETKMKLHPTMLPAGNPCVQGKVVGDLLRSRMPITSMWQAFGREWRDG